jgi:hypothetical protein
LTLNLDSYMNLCEGFLAELDVTSWNYLIGPIRSHFKSEPEEPLFQPEIDIKSRGLAEWSLNRIETWGS